MADSPAVPSLDRVADIARRVLTSPSASITRFATGLANWVFDVVAQDGTRIVVRIHRRSEDCAAALHWSRTLRPLAVPLPTLLAHHIEVGEQRSWLILERLPGVDLMLVYPTLSREQKRVLAQQIVRIQEIVATLPPGEGYGFVPYPRHWPHHSWLEVVQAELNRARQRIRAVGAVNEVVVDRIEARLNDFRGYFAQVAPVPFLDDTTTKNVIIHESQLAGIVDVDCVCFGDPLFTIGLTRMSLLNMGVDTDYIDLWLDAMNATQDQRRAARFYSAVFCVNFLSEQGQQFNRDEAPEVKSDEVNRLLAIFDRLIGEL